MQRPNILIIYTDQQRWDALGVNGNPDIQTPNLDRLAQESVNFDHYFVQNPVCMPSRASFLTGQYPSKLGITHMGVPLPEGTITLPKFLRNYGYHSANIGKLHFLPHANRDHRIPHPGYGFDHLEIADEPGPYEDAYRAWVRHKKPEQLNKISAGLPPTAAEWYRIMRVEDTVIHPTVNQTENGGRFDFKGAIPFPGDDDVTYSAFVAEQTLNYLEHRPTNQPFLCIASFYSPHSPWIAPQRFLDLYAPDSLTLPTFPPEIDAQRPKDGTVDELYSDAQLRSAHHGYYTMVTEVDYYVGQILDRLEETGLAEDTIVVFTSDHGEWLGEHLRYGKGYPGHDCVSRVPLLVRMPKKMKGAASGIRCEELVEGVDVIPTLLECAGIQIPPHLQGRSLYPILMPIKGREQEESSKLAPKPALMEFTGWKMLRSTKYRYVVHDDGREFLYDLEQPMGEYHDVASNNSYSEALNDMRYQLIQRVVRIERPIPKSWTY
ncbi:MAG: sulfatase-like hydrolase/transferase [Chloroflexota bacterium]